MPTYEKCDNSVRQLANELIAKYDTNKPIADAGVKIDFAFAYADVNDDGESVGYAMKKNGRQVFGATRILNLKDRALGRGDAEIVLDGDYWKSIDENQQSAILDHELHHLSVKTDAHGNRLHDDLGRPLLKLRKHDIEVGWFSVIAARYGNASLECKQAQAIMEIEGQFYFPDFVKPPPQIECKTITATPVDAFAKSQTITV